MEWKAYILQEIVQEQELLDSYSSNTPYEECPANKTKNTSHKKKLKKALLTFTHEYTLVNIR